MNRINKKFYLGILLGTGAVLLLVLILMMITDNEDLFLIAAPFIIFANIMGLVFHYKVWKAIPDTFSTVTPAKAVWFLFIPVFNLYWLFRSVYGFAYEFNDYVDRREMEIRKLPSLIYLLQCILLLSLSVLSKFESDTAILIYVLVLVATYINWIIMTIKSADAVNASYAWREAEKTASEVE